MFQVDPADVTRLDGLSLVELLRMLLYAEASGAGVPLRNVEAPLQITVADGGQDARIAWQGGAPSTEFLPARDVVFQCKATDGGDARWMAEVWTKKTQPKRVAGKVLNPAVQGALARGASYVGVTASALTGDKAAARVAAIRSGIRTTGGDPADLAAVAVYDANTLAAWATAHPAVALWLRERDARAPLASFATLDRWSRRPDLSSPRFVSSDDRGFSVGSSPRDVLQFDQLAGRIVDHLAAPGACVRIWGASGIGKTRALHQALVTGAGPLRGLAAANLIFCDQREVRSRLWDLANQLANGPGDAVLVVDECAWEDARRLHDIARADSSRLRVVTIGAEGADVFEGCLMVRPLPADAATIRGILASGLSAATPDELSYVAELCDGFPRIAVLAAASYDGGRGVLKSADDVAERILLTAGIDAEAVRALECLSLFEWLEPDAQPDLFDGIAETLVHLKGEMMFEHLAASAERHLVGRSGGRMAVQPRPIADYLALRRLSRLRVSTVERFVSGAAPPVRDAMLARWRFLARSQTLAAVVRSMLQTGALAEPASLVGERGAPFLVACVHAEPAATMRALHFAIAGTAIDDFEALGLGEGLLDALRMLASRSATFRPAARLIVRLAAAASAPDEPAMVLLRQLFQISLAGSEADDRMRREALAEALEDPDPRMVAACVEALGAMLATHMSRFGEFVQVGAEPFRSDWRPADHDVVLTYFNWSLDRLIELWGAHVEQRGRIERIIAGEIRSLLGFELMAPLARFVDLVVAERGHWDEGTRGIGDWLYFDRPPGESSYSTEVRALYDRTLPGGPVELALLHSRFWGAELHDPDRRYADQSDDPDFEYSARRVRALAPAIAGDPDQLSLMLRVVSAVELNAPYAFAEALAGNLADPVASFAEAVAELDRSGSRVGVPFVRSLLTALDRLLADRPDDVRRLVGIAEGSLVLSERPMDIFGALAATDVRVGQIAAQVRKGTIAPFEVVPISYGRGLAKTSHGPLSELVASLVARSADGGAWAALEILSMYTHGQGSLDPAVAEMVRAALASPSIVERAPGGAAHSDYLFDRMVRALATSGGIDVRFARAFAALVQHACRGPGSSRDGAADALRTGLALVVEVAAEEVWAALAGFWETATPAERERLGRVVSPTRLFASEADRYGAGPLFSTPFGPLLDWADGDPDNRARFLVAFFPILAEGEEPRAWHPALLELAERYGRSPSFRAALRSRIFPRAWSGSLRQHLGAVLAPLAEWVDDPVLGVWAGGVLAEVGQWLDDEDRL